MEKIRTKGNKGLQKERKCGKIKAPIIFNNSII